MGPSINVAVSMIECIKGEKYKSILCLGKQSFGYNVEYLINSRKKYNHNTNLEIFNNLD